MFREKGLSEQERLALLTSQLNYLSCSISSLWFGHYIAGKKGVMGDLSLMIRRANNTVEGATDRLIVDMMDHGFLEGIQKSVLKPIHKVMSIESDEDIPNPSAISDDLTLIIDGIIKKDKSDIFGSEIEKLIKIRNVIRG